MIYVFHENKLLKEYPIGTQWADMDTPFDSYTWTGPNGWYTGLGHWVPEAKVPKVYRTWLLLLK